MVGEIFQDNIVHDHGLLARATIQSQIASPFYTSVYAALVSVINNKFPHIETKWHLKTKEKEIKDMLVE
ncbi:unnamed protein product [Rotaria sp. Silwood1]|nr:unnamed protein product [Rotaria sp. Silwood1]